MSSPLRSARLRRIIVAYAINRLGTWFSFVALSVAVFDHLHSAIWHWQPGGELRKVAITGLPAGTMLALAGPCF